MEKRYYIIFFVSLTVLLSSCADDIPSDKYLLFGESFDRIGSWLITGEIDNSEIEPGQAQGEIENNVLYLHANGCTEVNANLPLSVPALEFNEYENMTVIVEIEEFTSSPIISDDTEIKISFKNFYLNIEPINNIEGEMLIFKYANDTLSLLEESENINYTFMRTSNGNFIDINLKSEGIADCTASAELKLNAIMIYNE